WELSRRGRSQQTCRDTTREFLPFFSRNPAVSRGNPTPADDVTARGVLFVERNRLRVRLSRSSGSSRSGRSGGRSGGSGGSSRLGGSGGLGRSCGSSKSRESSRSSLQIDLLYNPTCQIKPQPT